MKFIKENIVAVLMVAIAVLVTIMVMSLRNSPPNEKLIRAEMEIEQRDMLLKVITDDRERFRSSYDSVLALLNDRKSSNEATEKQIIYKYEKVPVYINSLNRDSLSAAVKRHVMLSD